MFDTSYPFYSIIEVASNNDPEVVPEDSERLIEFIGNIDEHIHDGIIPRGESQAQQIWDLRENIAYASVKYGHCLKYDVSLRSEDFYKVVQLTRDEINNSTEMTQSEKDSIVAVGYGHIGDGNLHLNISAPGHDDAELQRKLKSVVEPFIMNFVKNAQGSVSAEHGVGT